MTILEVLENAEYNLTNKRGLEIMADVGREQLHNAIVLLEKGYGLFDTFETVSAMALMGNHGDVDDVPEAP